MLNFLDFEVTMYDWLVVIKKEAKLKEMVGGMND